MRADRQTVATPPAAAVRPRGERRNRETEVVEAAVQVFYAKGYPAASIQDVADKVGVLKGSLYHYISSKEDLLFQIASQSHEQAGDIIANVEELGGSAMERLERFLFDIMTWYLTHIERVSIYFNEGRHLTGDRLKEVQRDRREFEGYVRKLIIEAAANGMIRDSVDPKLATLFTMGSLNSVATWYRKNGAFSVVTISKAYVDLTRASLIAPAA